MPSLSKSQALLSMIITSAFDLPGASRGLVGAGLQVDGPPCCLVSFIGSMRVMEIPSLVLADLESRYSEIGMGGTKS